ncbi:MAG: hypothetical protein H7A00_01890 [Hahellaceae bacterium]|nr:hypothetical protein [Hahellaceae bacterium]
MTHLSAITFKRTLLFSATTAMLLASVVEADVKSLSSNELTETYIKDSTIIVAPKKRQQEDQANKKLATITISPGDAPVSDEEKQYEFEKRTSENASQLDAAIANADEQVREAALSVDQAALGAIQPTIPEIVFANPRPTLPGVVIPEGDFDMNFVGNDLGLSRAGDQVTFSFGNLPGVDTINVPQSINGEGVQLIPRQGGGFDLIIDVPK